MQESPVQRFMRRPKRVLLGVALTLFCLASAESVRADSKVYQDLLHSTGLVEVPHPKGWVTYGTCWLVDDEHGLALTAQHLVMAAAEVVVYFPAYRDGTALRQGTNRLKTDLGGLPLAVRCIRPGSRARTGSSRPCSSVRWACCCSWASRSAGTVIQRTAPRQGQGESRRVLPGAIFRTGIK
jgi:hypothetical protein